MRGKAETVERKPDITDEDIGIKAFHLRKERAAERAVERLRAGLGRSFAALTADDMEVLVWTLGETWALQGFYDWEAIKFSTISFDDVDAIIVTGREIIAHRIKGKDGFDSILAILDRYRVTAQP